jgi:hypothetical protein
VIITFKDTHIIEKIYVWTLSQKILSLSPQGLFHKREHLMVCLVGVRGDVYCNIEKFLLTKENERKIKRYYW